MWLRDRVWRAALVAGSLAGAAGAHAETIEGSSTTLGRGGPHRRAGGVHTAVPVFELVSVRATDFHLPGVDDMSVVMSGWGAVALGEPMEGNRGLGDLDLAFAEEKMLH